MEYISEDELELEQIAQGRLANNENYVAIVTSYKLADAKILKRT